MPLSYMNRYNQVFFFKKVATLRGKYRYYTTKEPSQNCISDIPNGFEIYEHPEYGQVFLRKKIISDIFQEEIEFVRNILKTQIQIKDFIVDVKKGSMTIFTCDINAQTLREKFPDIVANSSKSIIELLRDTQQFIPQLRFILENAILRKYKVQRRSMVGFRENWINLESCTDFKKLVLKYCPYLGRDAFYNLRPISTS
ncbi:MAG: hypothetical protein NW226_16445 [Microscillaceae bacterium]|nr:hypothetical protein [Microscillaceae bacterium]